MAKSRSFDSVGKPSTKTTAAMLEAGQAKHVRPWDGMTLSQFETWRMRLAAIWRKHDMDLNTAMARHSDVSGKSVDFNGGGPKLRRYWRRWIERKSIKLGILKG